MDQLPLDGRLTDLRAFARLGEEGVDLFLTDSTNAEVPGLHHARARHLLGDRQGVPARRAPDHRRLLLLATCTACSRCSTPPRRPAARSPWSGRSMVRNMGIAADLGYLHVPDGVLVDVKKLDDLRRRPGRAGLHRHPGRADGRAVADGQPRPPHRRRPRRHRAAGALADPRQRERRLPGHQRPDARWAPTSCTRATPRCTSRGTPAPASSSTATTSCSRSNVMPVHGEWRHLVANAELAVAHRRAARPGGRRRGRRGGRPRRRRGRGRPAPCRAATSTSTAPSVGEADETLLKDRRILRDEGFISVIVVVDSMTGKVDRRPGDHRARLRRGRRRCSTT